MNQDELKRQVAQAALDYVVEGEIVGVGTGSTVNHFIDALGALCGRIRGAVSSSVASEARLRAQGIPVLDLNEIDGLSVYIDGSDEINAVGQMIKGGGGALTREKIVAAASRRFVCIADESKLVKCLGCFPLPVEVIPMARALVMRQLAALGGKPVLRVKDNQAVITDNGCELIDVGALEITDPVTLENTINAMPGVVTVGLFARRGADVCLLGRGGGVETLRF